MAAKTRMKYLKTGEIIAPLAFRFLRDQAVLLRDAGRSGQTLRKNIKKRVFYTAETASRKNDAERLKCVSNIGEIQEHQVNFRLLHSEPSKASPINDRFTWLTF